VAARSFDSFLVGLRSGRTWGKVEQGETILPKGGGDTTIAGNNFYIREEADIYRVAAELHRLRMLKGDFGKG